MLEPYVLRESLTPWQNYCEEEGKSFYRQLACIGKVLVQNGVPVIFDATANRRRYRHLSRQQVSRLVDVFVDCLLDTGIARDPKNKLSQGSLRVR